MGFSSRGSIFSAVSHILWKCEKEDLKSPEGNPRMRECDGYSKLGENVSVFYSANAMQMMLDPRRLDDGFGMEETMRKTRPNTTRERTNNKCAKALGGGKLIAKLSAGNAVAQELKYHPTCLVSLHNRERSHHRAVDSKKSPEQLAMEQVCPVTFSQLMTYIIETKTSSDGMEPVIFRLADLVSLYSQRLEQLGVLSPDLNSTRLKDKLLHHIPDLEAPCQGRDVLLAFREDIGAILGEACRY